MNKKEVVMTLARIVLFLFLDIMIVVATGRPWWSIFIIGLGLYIALIVLFFLDRIGFENRTLVLMVAAILCMIPASSQKIRENKSQNENVGFYSNSQKRSREKRELRVWICTGPQSKRYHSDLDCKGLQSCSGEIKLVRVSEAKEMGRTPCGYCYPEEEDDIW